MNSKDIAYTARVSAAVWMIRKARKIASLLGDRMPEEQQAIEEEIVAIGRKMYDEAWQQKKPEVTHDPHARAKSRFEFGDESERDAYVAGVVDQIAEATHDPGQDHELEAYIAAVRELVPDAERWFVANDYHHKFTIAQSAQRWRNHVKYTPGREQQ